jgi:gluconokinase
MGVSGCGKSTVGRLLAEQLHWRFLDADDFHSPANVAKMREGIPLTDNDRAGWLQRLRDELVSSLQRNMPVVLACSALREAYRAVLRSAGAAVRFVYLRGNFATIQARLATRKDHYMPASLLESQFAALEEPRDAVIISVELSPADAVREIRRQLNLTSPLTDHGPQEAPASDQGGP